MMTLLALLFGLMAAAPQADDNPDAEPNMIQVDQTEDTQAPAEATDDKGTAESEKSEAGAAQEPDTPEAARERRMQRMQEMLKMRQAGGQMQPRQPIRRPTRRQVQSGESPIPTVTQRPQPGNMGDMGPDILQPPEQYQAAPTVAPPAETPAAPQAAPQAPEKYYPPLDPVQRSLMEIDLLQQHLIQHPDDEGAQVRLGLAYLRLGRPQEAIAAFEQAQRSQPPDPGLLVNMATAQLQQGDFAAARTSLQAALAIDPHYARALFNLGAVSEQQKKIDEALGFYKEALRYDPKLGDLASNPALVRSQLARVAQLQLYLETRSAPTLTVPAALPLVTAPAPPEKAPADTQPQPAPQPPDPDNQLPPL